MSLKEIFINNLKFYRKRKGMTQNELTLALNKSYNYINSVEQGKILPSFEVLEQISEALGIRAAQLFGEEASPKNIQDFGREKYIEDLSERIFSRLRPLISQEIRGVLK